MSPVGSLSLLLLLAGVSAVVPPPENVTVSCQNFHTMLHWNYSKQQPETSFTLNIDENAERKTTELQFDLTDFVWESVSNYQNIHYVSLKAVQGSHESEMVLSPTFTFNVHQPAGVKCELDFPPVQLSVKRSQDEGTVSFRNPKYFYRELRQLQGHKPRFDFTVISDAEYQWTCEDEEICRYDVSWAQSQKECCVQLRGTMFEGYDIVPFRERERICATNNDYHEITLAVLVLVFMTVTAVVILMVCKFRAWMKSPSIPPPSPLFTEAWKLLYAKPVMSQPPADSLSIVRISKVEEKDPCETDPCETDPCETETSSAGCSSPNPAGSMYMEDLSDSSSQQEAESGYDRPHGLVDMGGGDMVDFYKA